MKIETPLHTDHQLDQLAGQFEHWRQTRSHRSERIPQALWDQAVALARVLPRTRVAQHLRLSAKDLKIHMAAELGVHTRFLRKISLAYYTHNLRHAHCDVPSHPKR